MTKVSSISISGRIILNMHSLNNEGNEGNQVLTRQVTIVDKQGNPITVTAVSGDMLKHIQAEHLFNIAKENKLILCEGCKTFNANRITMDSAFLTYLKGIDPEEFEENIKEKYLSLKAQIDDDNIDEKEKKKLQKEMRNIEHEFILNQFEETDKKKYDELNSKKEMLEKEKRGEKSKDKKDEFVKNIKIITDEIKSIEKEYQMDPPSDAEKLDEIIKRCSIDEMEGVLVTNEKNNLPRKSIVEFGWLIGSPESNETENYFHVKFVPNASTAEKDSGNLGQNIFHRPANSGQYAFVSNMEIARLGYNDITKKYSIDNTERKSRYKALLKSMLYTIIKPNGAMRNTQNPHIVNFEGVITYSASSCPAPTVSAINTDYQKEIEKTTEQLNKIANNSLTVLPFSSISEFSEKFVKLIEETEPMELTVSDK